MSVILGRRNLLVSLAVVPGLALLGACSDSGDDNGQPPDEPVTPKADLPEDQGTYDQAKLLADNPLPDEVMGMDDAPVTIIEYASATCPHCASFHVNTLPTIKEKYIDTGRARLVFREFAFDPRAEAGFMLARCTDDKYFAMIDVLFKQQDSWAHVQNGREALLSIARLAGFSQESFEACLTDQQLLDDVRAVKERGHEEFDVDATPTFFINGKKYAGALTVDQMSAIIDSM